MKFYLSLGITCLAALVSAFLTLPSRVEARSSRPIKLTAECSGTLPSSSNYSDLFGYSLGLNDKSFIVGSPGASPEGAQDAGAVYFFHKNVLGEWEQPQPPFFIPFQGNYLSTARITTRGDWLFVSLPGTPSDNSVKNNYGSILAFKKAHHSWNLVQTIQNPQPAANNAFGFYLNYSGRDWLVVGAGTSSFAYFYKLNKKEGSWDLTQTIDLQTTGTIFVSIDEHHALITSPETIFPTTENGTVFAYHLKDGVWTQIQTLQGESPISTLYNTGDSYGRYTAIYGKWAIIGAPTDNVMADLAGAAYFYHYNEKKKEWVFRHKVYSDWPSVFFGSTVAINDDIAIVADPGKTIVDEEGIRHNFQGAANVYIKHPVPWDVGTKIWSSIETLIDPDGRAYDFLGGTGSDINDHYVGLGTSPALDILFPDGFPGKRALPYSPLPNTGRALLYRIKHKN